MTNKAWKLAVLAAAIAIAGCAKKKPADLPPPPIGADGGETGADTGAGAGDQTGSVGQAGLPGSREDFLRSVPADRVLFELDSYSLDGNDRMILDAQAEWLARYPNVRVTIEGHADERGTREYNLALGERRANAAKNYLVSLGIPANRVSTVSYGEERPAAMGSSESAWAQNRRAVTVVMN